MPEILDDIAYMSQEIGPRPAGTEEEQQAALYITEQLQKRAGLSTTIEDFSCSSQADLVDVICFGLPLIFSIAAIISGVLVIPCFIISLACAALYCMELLGRPMLSRVFDRGVSQNVVAKYKPSTAGTRSRKIILVSHYDSGKVSAELNGGLFGIYPIAQKASWGALAALPLIWLIRGLFFLNATGGAALFWNVITVIAIVLVALPVALFFMHRAATYNEAANSNGAGVAVLMETARRLAAGRMSEEEIAARGDAQVHGEEAARAAGLVPEGADISYAEATAAPAAAEAQMLEPETERERLDAAKAAVAALTGQPLRSYAPEPKDISSKLVQVNKPAPAQPTPEEAEAIREEMRSALGGTGAAPESPAPAAGEVVQEQQPSGQPMQETASSVQPAESTPGDVPAWFKAAQEKANKPAFKPEKPVRRSRYADALDAAVAASSVHFEEANRIVDQETEERLEHLREGIVEVQAPTVAQEEQKIEQAGTAAAPQGAPAPQPAPAERPQAADEAQANDQTRPFAPIYFPEKAQPDNRAAAPQAPAPAATPEVSAPAVIPAPDAMTDEPVVTTRPAGQRQPQPAPVQDGATTAMPPLDVAQLRAEASRQRQDAAAALQGRAPRTTENRVQVPASDEPVHDFSQIPNQEQAPVEHARRAIKLPEVAPDNLPPVADLAKQRAPLAAAADAPVASSNPSLSSQIPRISLEASGVIPGVKAGEEIPANKLAALRNTLPSLSGSISAEALAEDKQEDTGSHKAVSLTGSFASAGATSAFAPVGDELVADVDPDDMYIDDADDSSYETHTTETGAFAGPGYMDMPESRAHRFFGKFRKNKKNKRQDEQSASDWLNISDDFNATEVGAARGGWESFQQDSEYYEDGTYSENEDAYEEQPAPRRKNGARRKGEDSYDDWNGGAFSKLRAGMHKGAAEDDDDAEGMDRHAIEADTYGDIDDADVSTRPAGKRKPRPTASEQAGGEAAQAADEMKRIYQFRNPDVDVEVWFVALGSELAGNGGSKAFLKEHAQELRGSIIINLESLGAGELSYIEQEGMLQAKSPSSRMKRFLKKAEQASGVRYGRAKLSWRASIASLAMKHGFQAMSVVGMDGGKPALLGQGDDVLENVDEKTLEANADFVMGLIKNA